MGTRSILLAAAEPQTLVDVTQALGVGWEITSVASEEDALAQLEAHSFDALLVDFNLSSPDASELLNQALEKTPETVRFLLAYEADLALVAAKVLGSPHILPKPVEAGSLKSRVENGVSQSNPTPGESDPVGSPSDSPTNASVYSDVLQALGSPDVTIGQVGEIIARDPALAAEVLRLTNSDYLGLPGNITDPVEAVESLGLETLKALVMALQFLAEHRRLNQGYLSFDELWQHSINVGQIARDLVLFETKDRNLASQALAAGLLHDLGKVVLVTNFDDLYGRVHSLARKQPVSLWDVEKEMFGANHGEIGGCLVGMWNMPSAIVEAVALHHEPPLGEQEQLTPLAAVHIANVLERELHSAQEETMVAPIINTPFLNELGLLQRLPVWRAAFANRRSPDLAPEVQAAETEPFDSVALSSPPASWTANDLPGPDAPTRTTTSGQPRIGETTPAVKTPQYRRNWAYAGAAAATLALLALWLNNQSEFDQTEPVYARTRAEVPVVASPTPAAQPVAAEAPQATPAVAVSEQPAAPSPAPSTAVPSAAPSQAAPEAPAAPAPKATVANVPPTSVVPDKPKRDFRLNGIIYRNRGPSAIINGQTLNVGDEISGATVIAIDPTAVTLEINGQRRTYELW